MMNKDAQNKILEYNVEMGGGLIVESIVEEHR